MSASGPGRSEDGAHAARTWTVAEANGRLDTLRALLPELKGFAVRLAQVTAELERLAEFWGKELDAPDHPDRALRLRLEEESASLHDRLEKEVGLLSEDGIEIKDLDAGLVDFYGIIERQLVFLCWRRGEESIEFFHPLGGGYLGRRPIPASARGVAASSRGSAPASAGSP